MRPPGTHSLRPERRLQHLDGALGILEARTMDYDTTDIPAAYDRGRDHGPEVLQQWMNALSSHVDTASVAGILDLGCGTGRFSEALADHFGARVIGIDPSRKMLECARSKPASGDVSYQLGTGEAIPLAEGAVDVVFMSMVFHHFERPALVASECMRVLRPGGSVCLRAGTRERIGDYPYVPFFPSSRPLLEETLDSADSVRDVFESAGFRTTFSEVVWQQVAVDYSVYAEKLSHGADSILARIDHADFEAGLQALRSHGERIGDGQAVGEPIDFFLFRTQE